MRPVAIMDPFLGARTGTFTTKRTIDSKNIVVTWVVELVNDDTLRLTPSLVLEPPPV